MDAAEEFRQIADAQRDPSAFDVLYENHVDAIWRFCLSRLGSADLAADATSLTFEKALRALPGFRPRSHGATTTFQSWLMLIARNVVVDVIRKHRPTVDMDAPGITHALVSTLPSPEESAVASEERALVNDALSRLGDTDRLIVTMRMHGAPIQEITAATGLSASAVKTRHYRAHQRLRTILTSIDVAGEAS